MNKLFQRTLVVIDSNVDNYQMLVDGVIEGAEVFVLDSHRDGVQQITEILQTLTHCSTDDPRSLHIVSHGAPGTLYLGNGELSLGNLSQHVEELKTWAVDELLLYGCNVAAGDAGEEFINKLGYLTGSNIGASTTLVGSISKGANWHLEVQLRAAQFVLPFSMATTKQYNHTLALPGARSETVSGEVFLGGNFIELGIDDDGGFGTAASIPSGFFGTSVRSNLGMSVDLDGFGTGTSGSGDYFLPGNPEERWVVGYVLNGTQNFDSNGNNPGKTIPNSVTNTSSGDTLSALSTGTFNSTLQIEQEYSFGVDDKFFKTTVTLTNIGSESIESVRYMRSFDPDNPVDFGGGYATVNTVQATVAEDGYALVEAKAQAGDRAISATGTEVPSFFYSNDSRAVGSHFGFANGDPYSSLAYDSPIEKGVSTTGDEGMTIAFDVGILAPGASETVTFYTSLDPRPFTEVLNDIAPSFELADDSDSGFSNSDNITNDATPTFIGVSKAPVVEGDTITIYADGKPVGTGLVGADLRWSVTTSILAEGTRRITATVTPASSGKEGSPSDPVEIVIDLTAPTVQSVVVDGTTLVLTYDEVLDGTSDPATTDFVVSVNGSAVTVDSIDADGKTVTVTLATAVTPSDTITASYTPSNRPIQDAAGNDADALSSRSVTNNSVPDTQAPTLQNAAINGTTLVLTYDEALDGTSDPEITDFAVNVNGSVVTVNSVDINGKTVTVTLATAVTSSDTVTASYTPGNSPIQDAAGNDADALSGRSVTNNSVPDTQAPTLQNAAINGTTLVLTYDEVLDGTSDPATTDFVVNVNGSAVIVDSIDADGKTVTVTLATAVTSSDTVTASYTPGNRPIQDAAGNDADALSGRSVTNDSVALTPQDLVFTFEQYVEFQQLQKGIAPIFDEELYLLAHPDVQAAVKQGSLSSGLQHYNQFGKAEGRSLLPLDLEIGGLKIADFVDEVYYLQSNPDVAAAVGQGRFANGFEHFLQFGINEGRNPSSFYDEEQYLALNPDVKAAVDNGALSSGLAHFIQNGHIENRKPSDLFEAGDYLLDNPDVQAAVAQGGFASAFEHYLEAGASEARLPGLLFAEKDYLIQYSDVAESVAVGNLDDGFEHFITYGIGENRSISSQFDNSAYLNANPDVAAAIGNGLSSGFEHYFQYGRFEERPLF